MEDKVVLMLSAVVVREYPNAYSEKMKTDMFQETIRILPDCGVFRRWESTCYRLGSLPMAYSLSRT
jgi:hypothetical protein